MISTWLILGRRYISHPASVSLQGQDYTSPVGIFGYFELVTISYPSPLPRKLKVIAQDLASDTPVDITSRVKIKGNHLIIPCKVINQIGLMNATSGDLSLQVWSFKCKGAFLNVLQRARRVTHSAINKSTLNSLIAQITQSTPLFFALC